MPATRPVFVPRPEAAPFVREVPVTFTWFPGLSLSQQQKCIASLHATAAEKHEISPVLEVSSKSAEALGALLSAFRLPVEVDGRRLTVESAFQGSKVFERGGPYTALYEADSRAAKTDERLKGSGLLTGFELLGEPWPAEPKTAFYDWLYLQALAQSPELSGRLTAYAGFTDIAFNPQRSLNCQARAAALFVALSKNGRLGEALSGREPFLSVVRGD